MLHFGKKITAVTWLLFLACSDKSNLQHIFYKLDTQVVVTLSSDPSHQANTAWKRIDSLLDDWDSRYSQTRDGSEVLKINQSQSLDIPVSPQLSFMLKEALRYGDSTSGGFDLTILPVKELWGLGETESPQVVPSPVLLDSVLKNVDYRMIRITNDTVHRANSNVKIDCGGIAKGFALQEIKSILDAMGYHDYLIAAGDIISKGKRNDGTPWRIGVQHPRRDSLLAIISLDSGTVFTSGDYERFWMKDGVRYHHLFNPATGQSCRANQSLTIWSTDAVAAKFLSTGLFCRDKGYISAYVESRPNLECIIVDSTGSVYISPRWRKHVELISE